ncbi:SGNH hydrolase-type esterase domain-containing protein [Lentinula aff. detonsa]|uniref:SGNH hydrolase-type esterase domain-containing protein n=1 Tax=Lentinula aff. detonsa TaxID=2804958 RepID=A0AA38L2F1_9AGAR|nr:SGNH hydrolase-type esterase domain-containing protein [Lentinula aff. detonsa]
MSADINCYHFRSLFRMFIIPIFVVANLIRLSSAWNATFLPLGDSITYGYLSTDGNGYREDLLELITAGGNSVDYIGSIQAGTMADNWNDGYIGCTIDQIASSGIPALKMVPQVVLLMAGTNDINYQEDLANAPTRLMNLVDEIFSYSPNAAVIVSDIPLIVDDTLEPLVETYNSGIQVLLQERISEGQHVVHVTLSDLTSSEMADDLHPNDEGYQVLAQAWDVGIQTASAAGWIA